MQTHVYITLLSIFILFFSYTNAFNPYLAGAVERIQRNCPTIPLGTCPHPGLLIDCTYKRLFDHHCNFFTLLPSGFSRNNTLAANLCPGDLSSLSTNVVGGCFGTLTFFYNVDGFPDETVISAVVTFYCDGTDPTVCCKTDSQEYPNCLG